MGFFFVFLQIHKQRKSTMKDKTLDVASGIVATAISATVSVFALNVTLICAKRTLLDAVKLLPETTKSTRITN